MTEMIIDERLHPRVAQAFEALALQANGDPYLQHAIMELGLNILAAKQMNGFDALGYAKARVEETIELNTETKH